MNLEDYKKFTFVYDEKQNIYTIKEFPQIIITFRRRTHWLVLLYYWLPHCRVNFDIDFPLYYLTGKEEFKKCVEGNKDKILVKLFEIHKKIFQSITKKKAFENLD